MAVVSVRRTRYVSNVRGLGKELDAKLERIVARAARDGARHVEAISKPTVSVHATSAQTSGGKIEARVFVARTDWWAQIFDTGSLGKRKLPLKQPGRQEKTWKIRRRGKTYTARRSQTALKAGGVPPQYFFIRGKRHAEQRLEQYLRRGV